MLYKKRKSKNPLTNLLPPSIISFFHPLFPSLSFFFFLDNSKEYDGVLAHMLLIFRIRSTEDPEIVHQIVEHVLHEKLKYATGPPSVDPESVEIKSRLVCCAYFSYII